MTIEVIYKMENPGFLCIEQVAVEDPPCFWRAESTQRQKKHQCQEAHVAPFD